MGIADWSVPFKLRSAPYTDDPIPGSVAPVELPINSVITFPTGDLVVYRLRPDGCKLTNVVRETKDYVPQADGAILHRRFVGGMEMELVIQMWQPNDKIACDHILQEMVDTLEGYLYGLLNAGDNEGRIAWAPTGGASGAPGSNGYRMLDDLRLLSFPAESQAPGAPFEIQVTVDCDRPYAQDETQLAPAVPGVVTNYGNRPTFPVWSIQGPLSSFFLVNTDNNDTFWYDGTLPPAAGNIAAGEFVEVDTFRNTVTKIVGGVPTMNLKPYVQMLDSEFFTLPPGDSTITISPAPGASTALINAAWQ